MWEPLLGQLAGRAAATIVRFAARGGTPLLLGVIVGVATFVLATLDSRAIDAAFYTVCAQIFPVFVVALIVERRLADRLGLTENQWVAEAWEAFNQLAHPPSVPPDEYDRWEADWFERNADYHWVCATKYEDMTATARRLYRRRVAIESSTILFAVTALVIGQVASLLGVASGTTGSSVLYWLTTSMLAASFTVIVASAAGELFRGVAQGT